MNEIEKLTKNLKIKESCLLTKNRRKSKSCKTYSCKIDKSHLSSYSSNFLKMIFLEAKWFSNDILSSGDVFNYNYKNKLVAIKNKNKEFEVKLLKHLSSQIRQELVNQIKQDIVNLSKLKKKIGRVGKLKFKKIVKSIPLNQLGSTFKIRNNKYIYIQGCKKDIKINGLSQISKDAEIAKAVLTNNNGNYYLKVTCFVDKEKHVKTGKQIGIDFGIESTITTSEGFKFNIKVPETKRLEKLSRGLHVRTIKGSHNRFKLQTKINREYDKINNQKKDMKNKLVRKLVDNYDTIICQDENLDNWKLKYGKGVQMSCIKGIISDLKHKSETFILVDKFFPSTKLCNICGHIKEISIYERTYECPKCGNNIDRDTHSAINILNEGLNKQSVVGSIKHFKSPVEPNTSFNTSLKGINKYLTMNQEATLN